MPILFLYLFLTKQESVESIAVLYIDVGSNSELNYLETITEDLIFDLASTSQGLLKVSETGKVKKFKNTDKSLDELASEIGVGYVFQAVYRKMIMDIILDAGCMIQIKKRIGL